MAKKSPTRKNAASPKKKTPSKKAKRPEPRSKRTGHKYEAQKKHAAEASRQRSAEGRDIGGIPEIKDAKRRAKAKKSFRFFCETYFPEAFNMGWSKDHLTVIGKLQKAILTGGKFAVAMPRGSGKTTLSVIACIWALLFGFRRFVALICVSEAPAVIEASNTPATPANPTATGLPTSEELLTSMRNDIAGETDRVTNIRRLCAKYGVDQVTVDGKKVNLEAHAIREGWDAAKTELEAMRGGRPEAGPGIHIKNNSDHAAGALEASLCLTAGMGEEIAGQGVSERSLDLAASRDFRTAGIHAVMHETIRAAGGHARPGVIDNDFIRAAFRADQVLQASGTATVSLSVILGNVANKSLLKAYRAVPDVVHKFCAKTSNRNFHKATRVRLTGDATFLEVGADGELKSFDLGEESYEVGLKTHGRIVKLNRPEMINDDLGAFLQLPKILGRGAGLARNKAVFTQLLAAVGTFFAAGNKNYLAGATTALDIDSLSKAEQLFLQQEDAKGNPIEVTPALLLCSPANKVLAEQLYKDRFVEVTTSANKAKTNGNPHAGKFEPIHSPWMSTAKVGNASNEAWALLGDPNDVPVMEVAYLNGREMPVLESSEADFDTLGMKWRSYWDFAAAMANETGGVFVKGKA